MAPSKPLLTLPNDKQAEQAVLGAIILNNVLMEEISDTLRLEDFYSPAHQKIYQNMLELYEHNSPIDEVTLGNLLEAKHLSEKTGGTDYLIELVQVTPVVENADYYVKILQQMRQRRDILVATQEIVRSTTEGAQNVDVVVDRATEIFRAFENESDLGPAKLGDVLLENFKKLEELSHMTNPITGVPTGFEELDELTRGFQAGDLLILAGRPSMGKTALAMNIAQYASVHAENQVSVFSLEMPKEQIAMRLLGGEAKVEMSKLWTGNLDNQDWDQLAVAAARMMDVKVWIDDTPTITPAHIRRTIRQIQKRHALGLIIVDYLQLMKSTERILHREQEISEISRTLKAIAKEFKVPVLALSQLNRDLERRPDKRPKMADLRESGAIEQDADMIMFIYRDEVYNEESEDKGLAELIIAKNRNGATKTIKLAFLKQYTKFVNLSLREPM